MLELTCLACFVAIIWWVVSTGSHLRFDVRLELLTLIIGTLMAAAYVVLKRFEGGLGAISHLSDRCPWGIWIAFDLCGVALAAGGFVLAGAVHVFHMRRFEPVLRPAVLTALIAYQLVAAILVFDLGRPYRFWHPLVMWQPHSVMFEITLCLSLYTIVLLVEFSSVLAEHWRWRQLAAALHAIALPTVMLGVILSTLHQSSFGSLFLIVPGKLHPLWYTPMLPVLFVVSAVAAGMAAIIGESHLCARFLHQQLAPELLVDLGRMCGRVLWIYLALKLADLAWSGAWRALPEHPWLGASFVAELLGGVIAPAVVLGRSRGRRPRGLLTAAVLVIAGVVLNRLNVCWFGLAPYMGFLYVPSWMEVVLTGAFVLLGVMAFVAICRFLPVFPTVEPGPSPSSE